MTERPELRPLSRRTLLAGMVAAPLAYGAARAGGAETAAISRLVVREKEPSNLESDYSAIQSFITPNDAFYVRSHFAVPHLEIKSWRLKVEGSVKSPFDISFDDLTRLP